MSVLDPRRPIDDLSRVAAELAAVKGRLDALEAPSGTQAFRTVAKLTVLVEDIQAALDEMNATRYTNAQIEALIDQKVAAYVEAVLATNVVIGGSLRVEGTVILPGARNTDLTASSNRITAWLGGPTDNRLGHT